MHKETLSFENTYKSASPKHAFLMIHHQPLMAVSIFLPHLSFFPLLSVRFHQLALLQLISCFQITRLPKGQAPLYHLPLFIPHSRLSPALVGTGVFRPSCHLRPPSPVLSFPPSCLQRPDPCLSPLLFLLHKKTESSKKTFLYESPAAANKGIRQGGGSLTRIIKPYTGQNHTEFIFSNCALNSFPSPLM